jgi:hypothetical protein
MDPIDHILKDYPTADLEKRLSHFLDCPELRTEFMEIEIKEYRQAAWANNKGPAVPKQTSARQRLATIAGFCLKFIRT